MRMDGSAFRQGLFALGGEFHKAAGDALEMAVDAAAMDTFKTNEFRNKTWKLRTSTKATVNRFALKGRIRNATHYASYIEEGTKPHVIQARKAPLLRFYWTRHGFWFAGKKVNHPGTKPRPFFRHAGEVGLGVLESAAKSNSDAAINRFNQAA